MEDEKVYGVLQTTYMGEGPVSLISSRGQQIVIPAERVKRVEQVKL